MSAIDDLPPLREVIAAHGLRARKSLGQNFLLDLNLTARIALAGGPLEGATIVEIGPGPGGLTRALLAKGAARVIAIERDERCLPALAAIAARYPERLTVIAADALSVDWQALGIESPTRIVANLPYNIATPLLTGWIEAEPWPPFWDGLTLMFQRELAWRIVATPRERADYGRLAVLCGWRTQARILFDVMPSAFTPPPKVTSSLVRLVPRPDPLPCDARDLADVTAAAFGQRRKMLRQSLRTLTPDPTALLAACRIVPTKRAEAVSIEEFAALARAWRAMR